MKRFSELDERDRYQIQMLAREQMVCKLLADVAQDMTVCQMEGWDVYEYPARIADEMRRILRKETKR